MSGLASAGRSLGVPRRRRSPASGSTSCPRPPGAGPPRSAPCSRSSPPSTPSTSPSTTCSATAGIARPSTSSRPSPATPSRSCWQAAGRSSRRSSRGPGKLAQDALRLLDLDQEVLAALHAFAAEDRHRGVRDVDRRERHVDHEAPHARHHHDRGPRREAARQGPGRDQRCGPPEAPALGGERQRVPRPAGRRGSRRCAPRWSVSRAISAARPASRSGGCCGGRPSSTWRSTRRTAACARPSSGRSPPPTSAALLEALPDEQPRARPAAIPAAVPAAGVRLRLAAGALDQRLVAARLPRPARRAAAASSRAPSASSRARRHARTRPGASPASATYAGGFVRSVNGSAAVSFEAGVWLDLVATGPGNRLDAPYDTVARTLRLAVLRHDLATSTSQGEPSAMVRLLADLGFTAIEADARALPDLDGQETSLAIHISLPQDAIEALVEAAGTENAWSTAYLNAGFRWLEPGLEENEANDLRMQPRRDLPRAHPHPRLPGQLDALGRPRTGGRRPCRRSGGSRASRSRPASPSRTGGGSRTSSLSAARSAPREAPASTASSPGARGASPACRPSPRPRPPRRPGRTIWSRPATASPPCSPPRPASGRSRSSASGSSSPCWSEPNPRRSPAPPASPPCAGAPARPTPGRAPPSGAFPATASTSPTTPGTARSSLSDEVDAVVLQPRLGAVRRWRDRDDRAHRDTHEQGRSAHTARTKGGRRPPGGASAPQAPPRPPGPRSGAKRGRQHSTRAPPPARRGPEVRAHQRRGAIRDDYSQQRLSRHDNGSQSWYREVPARRRRAAQEARSCFGKR